MPAHGNFHVVKVREKIMVMVKVMAEAIRTTALVNISKINKN